jgi:hypothetical protein
MCLMLMFRNSSAVYFADDPKAFFSAKKILRLQAQLPGNK